LRESFAVDEAGMGVKVEGREKGAGKGEFERY
jgi:hypothetical protein